MLGLQALFTGCSSKEALACCSCKEENEVLTAAWIDSLERVSVLPEASSRGKGALDASSPGAAEPPKRTAAGDAVAAPGASPDGGSPDGGKRAAGSLPVSPAWLGLLQVPPEFDGARRGVLSAAASAEGCSAQENRAEEEAEERRCLQASLRAFTRALLRGISVNVLLDDGRTRLAEARLDSELTHLVLHVPHAQHPVALKCIESVCTPDEAVSAGGVIDMPNQAFYDERCTTLIIRGGQFLTFVFDSLRTRGYFEMCLKVLILAKGGGTEPKPSPAEGDDSLGVTVTADPPQLPLAPRGEGLRSAVTLGADLSPITEASPATEVRSEM